LRATSNDLKQDGLVELIKEFRETRGEAIAARLCACVFGLSLMLAAPGGVTAAPTDSAQRAETVSAVSGGSANVVPVLELQSVSRVDPSDTPLWHLQTHWQQRWVSPVDLPRLDQSRSAQQRTLEALTKPGSWPSVAKPQTGAAATGVANSHNIHFDASRGLVGRIVLRWPQPSANPSNGESEGANERSELWAISVPLARLDVMGLSYRWIGPPQQAAQNAGAFEANRSSEPVAQQSSSAISPAAGAQTAVVAGAWHTVWAGDRVPMDQWQRVGAYANFVLPSPPDLPSGAPPAQLEVMVHIAHIGAMRTPVLLHTASDAQREQLLHNTLGGGWVGVSLALALICAISARRFGKAGFWAMSLFALVIAMALAATYGIAGQWIALQSAYFNDQIKFVCSMLVAAWLPWTVAAVLEQRWRERTLWRLSLGVAFCLSLLAFFVPLLQADALRVKVLPAALLCSVLYAVWLAGRAAWLGESQARWVLLGAACMSVGLAVPLLHYVGWMPQILGLAGSGSAIVGALLIWTHAIYVQHRSGRSVLSASVAGRARDNVTGLFNSTGFDQELARYSLKLGIDSGTAAYFHVALPAGNKMRYLIGDESYEHAVVRIASAVASAVGLHDLVARVSDNVFCAVVQMPRDQKIANSIAQRMLAHIRALAEQGVAATASVRIAMAWMPVHGHTQAELAQRCDDILSQSKPDRAMVWVG
jgi:GGDEF domain-containing protein